MLFAGYLDNDVIGEVVVPAGLGSRSSHPNIWVSITRTYSINCI
jgi:hypothetical protein